MLNINRPIGLPTLNPITIAIIEKIAMIIIRVNNGLLRKNNDKDSVDINNILQDYFHIF